MRASTRPFAFSPDHRLGTGTEGFDWEELPSLIHRVVPRPEPQRADPAVWPATESMDLAPGKSLRDPIPRPRVRALEVTDSELQRLFYADDLLVNPHSAHAAAGQPKASAAPRSPDEDVML